MIEVVTDKNIDEILPLMSAYMAFYHVQNIDDARNKTFFSQFGEGSNKGCLFLYNVKKGSEPFNHKPMFLKNNIFNVTEKWKNG